MLLRNWISKCIWHNASQGMPQTAGKHISSQEPCLLATKLWSQTVAIPTSHEEDVFETSDGVPQGDPLSTLVFATAMSLLTTDIIRSNSPNVSMVAYVDDTVLLGPAQDVAQAISEIQAKTAVSGLNYKKPKRKSGLLPKPLLIMNLFFAHFKEGWETEGVF